MLTAGLTIAQIIADIGITSFMAQAMNRIVQPATLNTAHKLCLVIGEAALIGMVCDKCNDSMEKGMDELVELYKMVHGNEVK